MSTHKVIITENSKNQRDFQENTSKSQVLDVGEVARGAGFEPARPIRTTGLAGLGSLRSVDDLPPTRLGQPRTVSSVQ